MELTEEMLQALGFEKKDNAYVDEWGVMIYADKLPTTLLGLKRVLTGTAYIRAEEKFKADLQAFITSRGKKKSK